MGHVVSDIFRSYPGGAALAGRTVSVYRHADDALLDTATTDSTGLWSVEFDWPPGPLYWECADGGITRRGSSKARGLLGYASAGEFAYALQGLGNGVIAGLDVTATGTRQVSVAAGSLLVKGITGHPSNATSPASAGVVNGTGSDRIDTLVVEVTPPGQAEEGKMELKIVQGTTSAPALTQSDALWQFPLADLTLEDGGTTYTVEDRRVFLLEPLALERAPTLHATATVNSAATVSATTPTDATAFNASVTLLEGVTYDVDARASLTASASAGRVGATLYLGAGQTGTEALSPEAGSNAPLFAVHARTVVGTGAPLSCGVLLRKTSSPATASVAGGTLLVRAVPRSGA